MTHDSPSSRNHAVSAAGERILAVLTHAFPRQPHTALRMYLRMTVTQPSDERELDAFLIQHQDALTRARCDVPERFVHLAHILTASGGVDIARPYCAGCARVMPLLPHRIAQGRCCLTCAYRCGVCGEDRRRVYRTTAGLRCAQCRPAAPQRMRAGRECVVCARLAVIPVSLPLGPTCEECFTTILQDRTPCTRCDADLPRIGLDEVGEKVCGPCAGSQLIYACRRGRRVRDNHGPRCGRCTLAAEVNRTLLGPDNAVVEQLKPLRDMLLASTSPVSTTAWLRRSPAARLLSELAASAEPITHESLDLSTQTTSRSVGYVRDMLTSAAVLAVRDDEYLRRAERWITTTLAAAPDQHATLLTRFTRWYLLPRARRPARRLGDPCSRAGVLRAIVTAALRLLAWLDTHSVALRELTQTQLDHWIDTGGGHHRYLYPFISWCHQHHEIDDRVRLEIPNYRDDPEHIQPDTRLEHLRFCLATDQLPLTVRVAGVLMLLFGLRLTLIVTLRRSDLVSDDTGARLWIHDRWLSVPPRIARLLDELAAASHPASGTLTSTIETSSLMFPGRSTGRNLRPETLSRHLAQHGIAALPARNSARLGLADELPAAVLAQLTGIDISTAVQWSQRAHHDWTDYVAARSADLEP